MRKEGSKTTTPGKVVEEIRRRTRRRFSAEEKIRIVLEGLRGEESIATLCRKRGPGAESLLSLEQGVSRSGEETARRRHGARVDVDRGHRTARGEHPVEAARGGNGARETAAQENRDGCRFERRGIRMTAAEKREAIRLRGRVGPVGAAHPGRNPDSAGDVLPVVSPLLGRRHERVAASAVGGAAVLESHSADRPTARRRSGPGHTRALAAGASVAIHRPRGPFPLEDIRPRVGLLPFHLFWGQVLERAEEAALTRSAAARPG
jgi:transposase